MKRLLAFSLAEVLIALSIVGIVGALTLPNVKKTYMQKEAHAKATKVQHILDTATLALVRDNGSLDAVIRGYSTDSDRSKAFLDAYAKYMKFSTMCGKTSSSTACFPNTTFNDPLATSSRKAFESKNCTSGGAQMCKTELVNKAYFTPMYPNCGSNILGGTGVDYSSISCVVTSSPGSNDSNCATAVLNDGTAIAFCSLQTKKDTCTSNSKDYCPNVAVYFDIKGPQNLSSLAMTRNVFFGYISDEGFYDYNKTIASISDGSFSEENYTVMSFGNLGIK